MTSEEQALIEERDVLKARIERLRKALRTIAEDDVPEPEGTSPFDWGVRLASIFAFAERALRNN